MTWFRAGGYGIDGPVTFAVGKTLHGTVGDDTRHGTADDDTFKFGQGGTDTLDGKGGNDLFQLGASLDPTDQIEGGRGTDTVYLSGDYSTNVFDLSHALHGIEKIFLVGRSSYVIDVHDIDVHGALSINAGLLRADDSAELHGGEHSFNELVGGKGDDRIFGGGRQDVLYGSEGDDHLVGGGRADLIYSGIGSDTFIIEYPKFSTGPQYDRTDYDPLYDKIGLSSEVTGVDETVHHGSLEPLTFDEDLARWVGKHDLSAGHAVIFDPDSGQLSSTFFLIIDHNGKAGYQPGKDFVITIGVQNLDALSMDNFFVVL